MTEKRFWWQDEKLSLQEKEKLIKNVEQDASYNEIHYYGCSQSVLGALQKNLGIGNVDVFKAATALSGGVSSMGQVCGAVTGAIMAIGLVYGREKFDDKINAHDDPVWLMGRTLGRYFCERFRRELGYLTCPDIKYQVRGIYPFEQSRVNPTPEEWERLHQNHDKCGDVCATAARLSAEVILEPGIVSPWPF